MGSMALVCHQLEQKIRNFRDAEKSEFVSILVSTKRYCIKDPTV
jgi:hypothetical protein